jgi:hypothetical protein
MKHHDPAMSFDEEAAAGYDEEPDVEQRRDTQATVAFLEGLAGGGPALELAFGTVGWRCPLPRAGFTSTASTSHPRWWQGYTPSRVVTSSR